MEGHFVHSYVQVRWTVEEDGESRETGNRDWVLQVRIVDIAAEPSTEDIDLTRRLRDVGDLVGIPLLDHIVIGCTDYTSIAELIC